MKKIIHNLRKMFHRIYRIKVLKDYSAYPNLHYKQMINWIENQCDSLGDSEMILDYLELTILIFKKQLTYDFMGLMFRNPKALNGSPLLLFPDTYKNSKYERVSIESTRSKDVSLTDPGVIVYPENSRDLVKAWRRGKKYPFKYDKENHNAYYYEPMGLCFIFNGKHSSTEGILRNKGSINCRVLDLSEAMENIYTDGIFWYNRCDDSVIDSVFDYRLALVFELTQLKVRLLRERQNKMN